MRWIDYFERVYVDLYRALIVFVALLAILAMLGAGLFYLSTLLDDSADSAEDLLKPPRWADLRGDILPLSNDPEDPAANSGSDAAASDQPPAVFIDERVVRIHTHLSRQFERNPNGVETFRELLPQRVLQQVILDACASGRGQPKRCLEDLERYAKELGSDDRINRIGDIQARLNTLVQALELWFQRYQEAVEAAAAVIDSRKAAQEAQQAVALAAVVSATQTGIGILLGIILLVVLIRIEVHLRSVASNLQPSQPELPSATR